MAENWVEEGSKNTSAPTSPPSCQTSSTRRSRQRAESQSLHRWSAKYCPLMPPPRSTIAAAFSSDGKTLASTHGDHTVKIIDCQTGKCLKVLGGHRRTPWVVRYHPLHSDILASGSLDHEVRLWDANTSDCIGSQDFQRPIASIAFHARGEILAVASGHKLFIWNYNRRGESSAPTIILRTRRSLRAVHFHPHGAPYLLTAEVNNLDSADSQLTHATSTGYSNYPSALFFANINSRGYPHLESNMSSPCLIWPAFLRDDGSLYIPRNDLASGSTNVQQSSSSLAQNVLSSDAENQQSDQSVTPMDVCPGEPSASSDVQMPSTSNSLPLPAIARPSGSAVDRMPVNSFTTSGLDVQMFLRNSEGGNHHHDLFSDSRSWELPFLHGWLMAQSQTGASSSIPIPAGSTRGSNRHYASRPHALASVPGVGNSLLGPQIDEAEARAASLGVGSELATSLFSAGAAELPCTVKLRVWRHDIKNPCVALETKACCLTISHAVLCSEMGAHFSPCGRFLVACVACLLPQTEGDQGSQLPVQYESTGAGTSPTRHPLPSHGVIYELRVYSLEEATFGEILTSRAIRAAHCLTSIQFSPTSEHILLAYGRRHSSLLRSIVMDAETTGIPVYTILEVYRVSDMELVRVLPSAEDEVNVACFHPSPGGGLVYGTKEGKLRILQHNGADAASMGLNCFIEENMLEVQRYALEG
ncbi:Activating molecule in BECN1-regulated autophagy protein 1 [Triticum urartu]|uniref:Activating molecule in BECN1-regulated autophagy protein 1 n=1 Tax=Triticum urartu TaxID=4572 RepID=M8AEQ5_TRIUA|nr:Activating molecule in BECN1-regulated autophagy protein 1 [Triticum urartu]